MVMPTKDIVQLLETILISIEKKVTENPEDFEDSILEDLSQLDGALGEVVDKSLSLLDERSVRLYRSQGKGKRELLEIVDSTNTQRAPQTSYKLLPLINQCSCQAYKKFVLTQKQYCCKHYLATRLAHALGKIEVIEKSEKQFRCIIKQFRF